MSYGSFAGNTVTLVLGTLLAQLINFGTLPVLTRIYSVEDFGHFALYSAIAGFGTVVATARYEMAIMLPRRDKDANNLVVLSILIASFVTVLCFLLVPVATLVCRNYVSCALPYDSIYLVPITILFAGVGQALNYWLSRNRQFRELAKAAVIQALATAVTAIAIGYLSPHIELGLIAAAVAGQFASMLYLIYVVKIKCELRLDGVSCSRIRLNAIRYKNFPLVNSAHVVIDALQNSGVPLLIGWMMGSGVLGAYSVALRVVRTPVNLLSSAISQVFFQKASFEFARTRNIRSLYVRSIKWLSGLAILLLLFLLPLPKLFQAILGLGWGRAGDLIYYMIPWVLITFIVSPVSQVPIITNHQARMLSIAALGNLIIITSIGAGAFFGSLELGLVLLFVFLSIYFIFLARWFYQISGFNVSDC